MNSASLTQDTCLNLFCVRPKGLSLSDPNSLRASRPRPPPPSAAHISLAPAPCYQLLTLGNRSAQVIHHPSRTGREVVQLLMDETFVHVIAKLYLFIYHTFVYSFAGNVFWFFVLWNSYKSVKRFLAETYNMNSNHHLGGTIWSTVNVSITRYMLFRRPKVLHLPNICNNGKVIRSCIWILFVIQIYTGLSNIWCYVMDL